MKPPSQIRILNRLWAVKYLDESIPDSHNAWGWCDPGTQTIHLVRNQKPDCMADTMLHEIIHAIFDSLGMQQDEEEPTIHRIAHDTSQVIPRKSQRKYSMNHAIPAFAQSATGTTHASG